jgi:hypothetical protein
MGVWSIKNEIMYEIIYARRNREWNKFSTFFYQYLLKYEIWTCLLDQRFSTWGTRTPRGTWGGYRGYAKSPQGCAKFKKPHPNEAYLGRIFYLGVREGDGGTQRGTILIWGYASTKRLRTPVLDHTNTKTHIIIQFNFTQK